MSLSENILSNNKQKDLMFFIYPQRIQKTNILYLYLEGMKKVRPVTNNELYQETDVRLLRQT